MLQNTLGDKAVEGMVGLSPREYSALIASQKLSFSDELSYLKIVLFTCKMMLIKLIVKWQQLLTSNRSN